MSSARIRLAAASVAAVAVGAIGAGCGASGTLEHARPQRPLAPEQGQPVASVHVTCSAAVEYRSLAQLRRDATSVAVFAPTGANTVIRIAGVPFTLAKVRLVATVAGARLPATLRLRQLGARRATSVAGCGPLVAAGSVYLAYVAPFKLRAHSPGVPGQYVVVGGTQGLFAHQGHAPVGDRSARSFHRVDPDSRLPQRISIARAARS
jgi:hypothetical protein